MIGRCRARPARSRSATSRLGGGEGAVHAADEVADEAGRHRELAVGEELDQHRGEEVVVRRLEAGDRRRAEPAREVGERDRPARRRLAAADHQAAAAGGEVVAEVEERHLGGAVAGQPVHVLDGERRVRRQGGEVERRRGRARIARPAPRRPDVREMGLARALRPGDGQPSARPAGPARRPAPAPARSRARRRSRPGRGPDARGGRGRAGAARSRRAVLGRQAAGVERHSRGSARRGSARGRRAPPRPARRRGGRRSRRASRRPRARG